LKEHCKVVFEIGPTHQGEESAIELIKSAKAAGADAVKVQILNAEKLVKDTNQMFTYGILDDNGNLIEIPGSSIIKASRIQFEENKIKLDRIIIESGSPRNKFLNSYNNIDIALDTFPYNGGTTSFELSWMCVPLLTIRGDRFISKCGESINNNLNMHDWIADDDEDYVRKAILFSNNVDELENIRKKLINFSRKSSLFNMKKYANNFSTILREAFNSCYTEN